MEMGNKVAKESHSQGGGKRRRHEESPFYLMESNKTSEGRGE